MCSAAQNYPKYLILPVYDLKRKSRFHFFCISVASSWLLAAGSNLPGCHIIIFFISNFQSIPVAKTWQEKCGKQWQIKISTITVTCSSLLEQYRNRRHDYNFLCFFSFWRTIALRSTGDERLQSKCSQLHPPEPVQAQWRWSWTCRGSQDPCILELRKTSCGYSMTRESEVSSGKYTYNNCYLFQSLGAEQKMAVMTILSYGFFFVLTTQWIDTTSKSDWRFVDQSFVIHTGSFYKIMISFENSRTTGHQYSGRRGPARNPRRIEKLIRWRNRILEAIDQGCVVVNQTKINNGGHLGHLLLNLNQSYSYLVKEISYFIFSMDL